MVSLLKHEMSPGNKYSGYKCCIFRTPNILSRHNPKAYFPNAFSIGPLHHGKPHLQAKIKSLYLHDFLNRGIPLTAVIEAVNKVEPDVRACYEEPLDFTRRQLVQILVVDGCFLVELFYRSSKPPKHRDDPIRTMARMYQYLCHDLILLENQIPWMDLIRESLIAPFKGKRKQDRWMRIRSAVALRKAGVELKNEKGPNILVVTFDKNRGVLEIPHLVVQETTETTFRNLLSYEQCYPDCDHVVTSYVILMDNLIDTSKDLDELCDAGVIENWLEPQEVTQMFSNLYKDCSVVEFYYIDLCNAVETYCKCTWPRLRAAYLNNFTSPLAIVSQVAATIGLVLTFLQTVFTIHNPK